MNCRGGTGEFEGGTGRSGNNLTIILPSKIVKYKF